MLRGSPLCTTYVGSYRDKVTLAQIPPAPGDVWCIDCPLRRGAYLMTLDGWENPAHGVLDTLLQQAIRPSTRLRYGGVCA